MADEEKRSQLKISTDTVYGPLETHKKYAHIIRRRPTLKYVEPFRNGSVRGPYEISLWANIYEWTFHRETCYINWAI